MRPDAALAMEAVVRKPMMFARILILLTLLLAATAAAERIAALAAGRRRGHGRRNLRRSTPEAGLHFDAGRKPL